MNTDAAPAPGFPTLGPLPADPAMEAFFRKMRDEFTRLILEYRFGVDEMLTKVSILREEFLHLHQYNAVRATTCEIDLGHASEG
ncbi:MAG: hypothetical protein LBQ92_02445 [Propionibacteriaceae bacterium]|jgi:putative GTP pyrophosphokinase|nr:hypothetical protein [Propionibacteriaceae bacterium]